MCFNLESCVQYKKLPVQWFQHGYVSKDCVFYTPSAGPVGNLIFSWTDNRAIQPPELSASESQHTAQTWIPCLGDK